MVSHDLPLSGLRRDQMEKICKKSGLIKGVEAAFPHTIPVLAGFLVLGMAYGVLMASKGYGVIWAVAMSTFAFCGSMQFAAITILTTAFHPLEAFVLSLLVNARHIFYGISLLDKYKGLGQSRFYLIFGLIDETFSILSSVEAPEEIEPRDFYLGVTMLNHLYWIGGTLLGSVIGGLVNVNVKGLDFALTALFVVLFIEQIQTKGKWRDGMIGVGSALIALWIFGSTHFVIPAMGLIVVGLLIEGRK